MFYGNLTRTELIYVVANVKDTNLLTREFLDALWAFHQEILDITVSVEPDQEAMVNASLPPLIVDQLVGNLGIGDISRRDEDTYWSRRLQPLIQDDVAGGAEYPPSASIQRPPSGDGGDPSESPLEAELAEPSASAVDPDEDKEVAVVSEDSVVQERNTTLEVTREPSGPSATVGGSDRSPSSPQFLNTGTSRRRRNEEPPHSLPSQVMGGRPLFGSAVTPTPLPVLAGAISPDACIEAYAPPKDRVSGLACRPPLPPGRYGFSNLCLKDRAGVCNPPDGVIFMYNDRR